MSLLPTVPRVALLVLLGLSLSPHLAQAADSTDANATRQRQSDALRLLRGAIDMHFHMDPPTNISPGANIDNVRVARLLGVRGLVFKAHGESTAPLAYLLGREMPDMTLIGGIVLNRAVGGINLAAVEHLANLKGRPGRVIWLPTEDSAAAAKNKPGKPFVPLSKDGKLLPEVKELIAFIGKNDLVLATGHSAPEDAILVLKEGQAQGLKHMIATHPLDFQGKMNADQLERAAQTGAILELDFRWMVEEGGIDVIKKFGAEHCLISEFWTYYLLPPSPEPYLPIEFGGLEQVGRFIEEMHARGITDQELDLMVKVNPARLLGIQVLGEPQK